MVATHVAPGAVPGGRHPGAARRLPAGDRLAAEALAESAQLLDLAADLGKALVGSNPLPGDRVPSGAAADPDAPEPASCHAKGGNPAAASQPEPAEPGR